MLAEAEGLILARGDDPGAFDAVALSHIARAFAPLFGPDDSGDAGGDADGAAARARGKHDKLLFRLARMLLDGGLGAELQPQELAYLALLLPPPTILLRTKWTRRVPHPVLIGHAASLTQY